MVTCDACYCESPHKDFVLNPDCQHGYDKECYGEFLQDILKEKGMSMAIGIKCVGEGCGLLIAKSVWKAILSQKDFKRFEE